MSSASVDTRAQLPVDRLKVPEPTSDAPPARRRLMAYVGLGALAVICILPFVWMLATSLKTLTEVVREPHKLIPGDPQFANYSTLWRDFPMSSWIWNSFKVSMLVTLGVVATSASAAYAFARIEFPGRT